MKTILVILGTRPEVIKLAPVILSLRQGYHVLVCNTEQQKELSTKTLGFFGVQADFNLNVMRPNQGLSNLQGRILSSLSEIYNKIQIDATIVQGDTITAFCGALASFYNRIPVFHVEAGLRSYNIFEPFPEEALRQMIARITDLHLAPTQAAKENLLKENIPLSKIFITGNTGIDSLKCLSEKAIFNAIQSLEQKGIVLHDKLILITVHRRENHGCRLDDILSAILKLAKKYPDHQFIIPVHPNPNIHDRVYQALKNISNVILTSPLDYSEIVCIMKNAKLILTDSGGIQEEAPTLGVPVLVMRYETERNEGVKAGFAKLVGTNVDSIVTQSSTILSKNRHEVSQNTLQNPYGDGNASERVKEIIDNYFLNKPIRLM